MRAATMSRFVISVSIASALALFAALPVRLAGQSPDSKLTTLLADLSRGRSLRSGTPSQAVQDAIQGGWLRITANDEAQVYILVSVLNDDVASQLTAAGATIEIQDVARRRVQARVPVDRLQAVAQLPVVDAIRLPSYAQHRVGAATSEGDALLYASEVRAQYSLDGTGVRVGVVSDGLKGVFATACTANCGGVDNGPMATSDLPPALGVRNASGVLTSATAGIVARSFRANGDLEGLQASS